MENKCPKCGKKLTLFDIKQECPGCGCDLVYYNIEENLEKDAEQAEKEFEALEKLLDKITPKFIKNKKK